MERVCGRLGLRIGLGLRCFPRLWTTVSRRARGPCGPLGGPTGHMEWQVLDGAYRGRRQSVVLAAGGGAHTIRHLFLRCFGLLWSPAASSARKRDLRRPGLPTPRWGLCCAGRFRCGVADQKSNTGQSKGSKSMHSPSAANGNLRASLSTAT